LWDPRWRWVGGGEYPRLSAAKPDLVLDRTRRLGSATAPQKSTISGVLIGAHQCQSSCATS
jgi:hypothetical protein